MTFFSVNFYKWFLLLYSIIFCRIGKFFTIVSSNRFSIFAIYLVFISVIGSFSFLFFFPSLCVGVGGIQGGYYIWRTKVNIKIRYLLLLSTLLLLLLITVVVVTVAVVEVAVFGTEFRASYMWGKHSTTKLQAQSLTSFWATGFPLNMELPTSSHWIDWPVSPRTPLCPSPVLPYWVFRWVLGTQCQVLTLHSSYSPKLPSMPWILVFPLLIISWSSWMLWSCASTFSFIDVLMWYFLNLVLCPWHFFSSTRMFTLMLQKSEWLFSVPSWFVGEDILWFSLSMIFTIGYL